MGDRYTLFPKPLRLRCISLLFAVKRPMDLPRYVITAEIDHAVRVGDRVPLGLLQHNDGLYYWHDADSSDEISDGFETIEEAKAACKRCWGNNEGQLTGDWV